MSPLALSASDAILAAADTTAPVASAGRLVPAALIGIAVIVVLITATRCTRSSRSPSARW